MDQIALAYKRRAERYPDEDEGERWNGVALDCYLRTGNVPREVLRYKALASTGHFAFKYRDDQPRVPAGNPDGGQWTSDGGSRSPSHGEESERDGGGDDNSENRNELPIEPAALRNRRGSIERAVRALRNWWRGEPRQKPYDTRSDPLTPNGELIGNKGKGRGVRTLTPENFSDLKSKMLEGARELPPNPRYDGRTYQRPDGTEFGIRNSKKWDETIDIFKSPNPKIEPRTKVHRIWPST